MNPDAITLVVVADGRRARLLEQRRIDGPLHDRPEWLSDVKEHHDHGAPSHITHSGDAHDRAEKAFLSALAKRVDVSLAERDLPAGGRDLSCLLSVDCGGDSVSGVGAADCDSGSTLGRVDSVV